MEPPCEGPAQNGPLDTTAADYGGIGIIDNPELCHVTNETSPERDLPPLECPRPVPFVSLPAEMPSVNGQSPLTMPSTSATTETTEDVVEETAVQQHVSVQNTTYMHNEEGVPLSVPEAMVRRLVFTAHESCGDGHDSDGELGPFFDAVLDEASDSEDEDELPSSNVVPPPPDTVPPAPQESQQPIVTLNEEDVKKMNVAQLKEELKKRKLTVNGVKATLQQRLLDNLNNPNGSDVPGGPVVSGANNNQNVTSSGFAEGATWKELVLEATPVPEPNNNPNLVGPTVPAGEREFVKQNFAQSFDRPPFTAMSPVVEIGRNGKPVKNRKGEIQWTNEIRSKGRANKEWVDQHGLTEFSKPSDWFEALLPLRKKPDGPRSMVSGPPF